MTYIYILHTSKYQLILFSTQQRSDRIVTGSFDKTAKVWASKSGECLQTFYGHSAEIVAAEFSPANAGLVATGSMDGTARIYHVATGQEVHRIDNHVAEVIAARFSRDGQMLLTGSFDNNAMIWDVRSKR